MSGRIFLGKMGKAFGPYTQQQFDELRTTGALREFSWIWDAQRHVWSPMDPPPAPLPPEALQSAGPKAGRQILRHDSVLPLEAICHDRRAAMTARLRLVSETGCELVSSMSEEPPFPAQSRVALNLLDPRSGLSMEVHVRLMGLTRSEGCWRYRVSWDSCPQLVLESIA